MDKKTMLKEAEESSCSSKFESFVEELHKNPGNTNLIEEIRQILQSEKPEKKVKDNRVLKHLWSLDTKEDIIVAYEEANIFEKRVLEEIYPNTIKVYNED
jgi:hypothetical protein